MPDLDWYSIEQLAWPTDWTAEFGREAPLLMEIGFGSGQFLSRLAQQMPEANILGIEISLPSLRNAARKIQRADLNNVRLLLCDGPGCAYLIVLSKQPERGIH
ncbi:MAG: methyltransferase domain-containing protein [Chloroflexota bacterium]